jgi:predicted amidohydrolase
MLIALASLNQVWENKSANLQSCSELFRKAKSHEAKLIVFPEMTLTGFSTNIGVIAEEVKDSPTIESFRRLAREHEMGVMFGIVFKENERATNNAVLLGEGGKLIGKYQKIHPFSFSGEDRYFNEGKEILSVNFGPFNIGMTVCYDLRFPEIYSALGTKSDIIVNIANWPEKRIEHWFTLLRARAIENQVFIVGVNRIGSDPNSHNYVKSSVVVNPNGEVLKPIHTEEELDIYEVDKCTISNIRNNFSTTQDRNPDFYKSIL